MRKNIKIYSKILFALLLANCISLISTAQWYDPEKVDKKAGEIYGRALEEAQDGKYTDALAHLNDALKIDPKFVEVYLSRGGIYAEMKDYKRSVAEYQLAANLDSVYTETYNLPYSISLAGAGMFTQALGKIKQFLKDPTLNEQSVRAGLYRRDCYQFAVDYERTHPAGNYIFSPENLGDSINSSFNEYFPSLTVDGNKMVFTRNTNGDEDFFESNFVNGHWTAAKLLEGKINTNLNEGAQNISQDGQWLIFTGCNYPEGAGSCDLYISYKAKNGGWTEPINMGPTINTEAWESNPCLSPDKKDLYFSSSRPGGYGGKDLWVSHRLPNGRWGRPENMGEEINTKGDECSPFMHADNQTLYFTSTGLPGYGLADLYFTKKINDSTWSTPQNLGYPINSIEEEGSLVVAADGKTSYYASDRAGTRGGLDIYSFRLRDDVSAPRTIWVKGKVFDKKTNQGLPSSVELTDIVTRQIISRLQTDEEGNYLITLPVGKDYAFNVNRKGYLFYSDNFSLAGGSTDSAMIVNIPLQPVETGAAIVLKNIFFDVNKFQLKPESQTELDKVVLLMNDNPNLHIQIGGYTDNVGKITDNQALSLNRAKAVTSYLSGKGINPKRLSSKGFGADNPIASNDTEQGRSQNRRTELHITSN